MRRLRREMRQLHREMRRLRRKMRRLRREMRREMRRLRREMRQMRRLRRKMCHEMLRLRRECVDCVVECVDCVVVKCVDCFWTSSIFSVTSDLTHWPNIDLWPHYIFMIMQIRPRPLLIFITPHEYSAPPLINIHHPSWIFSATSLLRDVTSLKGCNSRGLDTSKAVKRVLPKHKHHFESLFEYKSDDEDANDFGFRQSGRCFGSATREA